MIDNVLYVSPEKRDLSCSSDNSGNTMRLDLLQKLLSWIIVLAYTLYKAEADDKYLQW